MVVVGANVFRAPKSVGMLQCHAALPTERMVKRKNDQTPISDPRPVTV